MNNKTVKMLIFIFMLIYVVAPDLFPGPVDDLIVILLGIAAQKKDLAQNKDLLSEEI